MQEQPNEQPPSLEPPNIFRLKPRKSPEDYWAGYRAGLEAALHGIQRSLDHFDDMLAARRDENSKN